MDQMLLTILIFLPLAGALVVGLGMRPGQERLMRNTAIAFSVVTFILSLRLWTGWDADAVNPYDGMQNQWQVSYAWVPDLGINYSLGIDGISLWLVILTTFLTPLVLLGAYTAIQQRVRAFNASLLLLESAMIGTFLAQNLLLFYVFWELMLIPMVLIIGVWGGERRIYAAVKFFLYTMVGSLLMLVGILYVAWQHKQTFGAFSFEMYQVLGLDFGPTAQVLLFSAFALAFAIKVPLFPFHTWLPDAHVEAPTAGSVILAGVLLKMGTYGFVRFAMPLFPHAVDVFAVPVAVLSVIGIIYGSLVAMVQPDIKKLVAYSSVAHLGFVMLGLFALQQTAVEGSVLQMVNHGLSTGALFTLVGIIYERTHTRQIADYGGIARVVPVFTIFFIVVTLSSIGLPGLNGFVGEFMILLGSFQTWPRLTVLAATGVILSAVYMLWMVKRVFFGPLTDNHEKLHLTDVNPREIFVLVALLVPIVWIGVYPYTFTSKITPAVERMIEISGEEAEPKDWLHGPLYTGQADGTDTHDQHAKPGSEHGHDEEAH